jgi:hypothetical protein
VGAEFVWLMEDVLELYEEPYDPKKPVVCFDELPFSAGGRDANPSAFEAGMPDALRLRV